VHVTNIQEPMRTAAWSSCALFAGGALAWWLFARRATNRNCRKPIPSETSSYEPSWLELHGVPEDSVAWGFCAVTVGRFIYVLGHHSETEFYGYGLPVVLIYDTWTEVWELCKFTGVPLIWWNIGWLDSPELLAAPSRQAIFSPYGFQVGADCVRFDVLEVSTGTWHAVQSSLGPVVPDGCLFRFVHIQGFEVLALIFIFDSFDDDEELQEEERTGRLSIRLLDLAEGTGRELEYTGQPPPAWHDPDPIACYTAPFLYVFDPPSPAVAAADHCALYALDLRHLNWVSIAHHALPVPPLTTSSSSPEGTTSEPLSQFSRHFISHANHLTCHVTSEGQSQLYGLNTIEPLAPKWEPLCGCEMLFGMMDCYCATEDTTYHLHPYSGWIMACRSLWASSSSATSAPRHCALAAVTSEVLTIVFSFLGADILLTPHVCRAWRAAAMADSNVMEATWNSVPLQDIASWDLVPYRFAEMKLLLGELDDYLRMALPPSWLLHTVYAQRFRLSWQRCRPHTGQSPFQWCLSSLLQARQALDWEDEAAAATSCPVVAVDPTADELLTEGQLSRLRYVPAPSSHFLMEMLRRVTDTKMAPNVVKLAYCLPDAMVYAAYYCPQVPPLMDVNEAKQRALERVLQEAPTLAVVNGQQLMELAYITDSQPGRRGDEQENLTIQEFRAKKESLATHLPYWRRLSLGQWPDDIEGPVVFFLLSCPRLILLPYRVVYNM